MKYEPITEEAEFTEHARDRKREDRDRRKARRDKDQRRHDAEDYNSQKHREPRR